MVQTNPLWRQGRHFMQRGVTPKRVACDRTPVNKKYMPQPLFPVLNLPDFLLPVFNFRAQFLPGFLFRFCRGWSLFSICQHEKRQSISSDAFMGLLAFTHIPYRHYHSIWPPKYIPLPELSSRLFSCRSHQSQVVHSLPRQPNK